MDAIRVDQLTKYYDTLMAVDHVGFSVAKGEIFGFLGPNGAGKTTTIRMLTGLTMPSEGSALIMGRDIVRDPYGAKTHFGVVPEISNVYDDLSAWNNLMFAGELYGLSKADMVSRAKGLLDTFELTKFKDRHAKGFSKGMKRKLTISMALINKPDILFLDEPTSGLDVQSANKLKDIVRELNAGGVTIFLTTHNIEEASRLCDRIGIIVKGRLIALDAPEKLKGTIQTSQSIEVSFNATDSGTLDELSALSAVVSVRKEGDKYRLFTRDPPVVISAVCEHVKARGMRITTLNTLGPSLEEAYVEIVNKGKGGV